MIALLAPRCADPLDQTMWPTLRWHAKVAYAKRAYLWMCVAASRLREMPRAVQCRTSEVAESEHSVLWYVLALDRCLRK